MHCVTNFAAFLIRDSLSTLLLSSKLLLFKVKAISPQNVVILLLQEG